MEWILTSKLSIRKEAGAAGQRKGYPGSFRIWELLLLIYLLALVDLDAAWNWPDIDA